MVKMLRIQSFPNPNKPAWIQNLNFTLQVRKCQILMIFCKKKRRFHPRRACMKLKRASLLLGWHSKAPRKSNVDVLTRDLSNTRKHPSAKSSDDSLNNPCVCHLSITMPLRLTTKGALSPKNVTISRWKLMYLLIRKIRKAVILLERLIMVWS